MSSTAVEVFITFRTTLKILYIMCAIINFKEKVHFYSTRVVLVLCPVGAWTGDVRGRKLKVPASHLCSAYSENSPLCA